MNSVVLVEKRLGWVSSNHCRRPRRQSPGKEPEHEMRESVGVAGEEKRVIK